MYLYNLYIFFLKNRLYYLLQNKRNGEQQEGNTEMQWGKNFFSQNVSFCVPQKQSLRQGFGCMTLVKRNVPRKRKSQHKEVFWGHWCGQCAWIFQDFWEADKMPLRTSLPQEEELGHFSLASDPLNGRLSSGVLTPSRERMLKVVCLKSGLNR